MSFAGADGSEARELGEAAWWKALYAVLSCFISIQIRYIGQGETWKCLRKGSIRSFACPGISYKKAHIMLYNVRRILCRLTGLDIIALKDRCLMLAAFGSFKANGLVRAGCGGGVASYQ